MRSSKLESPWHISSTTFAEEFCLDFMVNKLLIIKWWDRK